MVTRLWFTRCVRCEDRPRCVLRSMRRGLLYTERLWSRALFCCFAILLVSIAAHGQLLESPIRVDKSREIGVEQPWIWVLPSVLLVSGGVFVNEFGLSGANRIRFEQYNGMAIPGRKRIDDYLQFAPLFVGVALDAIGEGKSRSLLEKLSAKAIGGVAVAVVTIGTKSIGLAERPDADTRNSFMSGHTSMAFFGAELLRLEYGSDYPWLASAGYGAAVTVAMFRIWHGRHWTSDVVAGAGVGIAAAWIGYYVGSLLADWVEERVYRESRGLAWQY